MDAAALSSVPSVSSVSSVAFVSSVRRPPRARFVSSREILREAFYGLYHHRFRAALSMLGISWGIISVVVLLAYGNGFRGALDAGFRGAFSDGTVVTFPGQTSLQAGGERAGKRVRVSPDDVIAMGELPLVKNVSPEFMKEAPIGYGNRVSSHLVRGVSAAYGVMRAEQPQPGGRFLDEEDVRLRRRVAFIGSEVQRKLFGGIPPVGETLRIAGQPFEIVGVLEEKVQLSNYNRPDKYCVFIPWTTMSSLADTRFVNTFVWQAVSPMMEPKAIERLSVPSYVPGVATQPAGTGSVGIMMLLNSPGRRSISQPRVKFATLTMPRSHQRSS